MIEQSLRSYEILRLGVASLDDDPEWSMPPGGLRYGRDGRVELLHFAPGRWLAPAPDTSLLNRMQQQAAAGQLALFDVNCKWQLITLRGSVATQLLSAGTNLEQVLGERDCASLTLFDTPCILARRDDAFDVWVLASYLADFVATLSRMTLRIPSA